MFINTKYRSTDVEIMDDFLLEGQELREALDKIASINQLLGGNKLTIDGIKKVIANNRGVITLVDVGCGNGDMLRKIADFGAKKGLTFNLIGIDANAFTINHAQKLSVNYPTISYLCEDIFTIPVYKIECDVIVCTLTLHHFKENQIIEILNIFNEAAGLGIIINDLQRSAIAYRLFQLLCVTFGLNRMSREDGLISILRGFKKEELIAFSEKLNFKKYNIQWKWAFRYQWIIQKK